MAGWLACPPPRTWGAPSGRPLCLSQARGAETEGHRRRPRPVRAPNRLLGARSGPAHGPPHVEPQPERVGGVPARRAAGGSRAGDRLWTGTRDKGAWPPRAEGIRVRDRPHRADAAAGEEAQCRGPQERSGRPAARIRRGPARLRRTVRQDPRCQRNDVLARAGRASGGAPRPAAERWPDSRGPSAARPGGQRRDLGGLGSGDGGGPGPGRLLRGAARDHGPEARGGLRAGREPGGRLTAEPGPRRGPGPLVRALGRAVNSAVARFPWSWRLFSGPLRRFFDSVAVGWDERVRSDSPKYLEPLVAALDRLETSPGRILDIGTGTGAAALALADRYPDAEVVGIDVSVEMVAQAKAKAADRSGPVRFLVADIATFEDEEGFDLIVMLNMPPFFDRVIALLRPEGFVVNASSFGSRTPFFTPS